ncbi:2-amino-4-hydroxy-6-hydroxymethyldihydropteridine diphosphokinase [Marisediminicola sp. LYQ85]|uniref:2-amino-4-hydroxy-6- hydroxymethyldihydropteridine diphosphokinase n=1 Tax=Marisediminicola sp. LYQ85 TaxID=3391062 RepID=UPI0039830326
MTGPIEPRRVVIALGSNLGDRESALRQAVRSIDGIDGVTVTAASDIVQSQALTAHGVDDSAPAYLNAVVTATVELAPLHLLDRLNDIERDLGRVRAERWGDRTIDLDIVAIGDEQLESDRLTIPHPEAQKRSFVLVPWLQIEPDAVLPRGGPVVDLVARLRGPDDALAIYPAAPLLGGAP